MPSIPELHRLKESVVSTVAGREVEVSLYGTPNRRNGRRIVATYSGVTVFDSDDCYDFANATNRYAEWVREEEAKLCTHCGKAGDADLGAQDQESGRPICDACVGKCIPSPVVTPTREPELVGDEAECPF